MRAWPSAVSLGFGPEGSNSHTPLAATEKTPAISLYLRYLKCICSFQSFESLAFVNLNFPFDLPILSIRFIFFYIWEIQNIFAAFKALRHWLFCQLKFPAWSSNLSIYAEVLSICILYFQLVQVQPNKISSKSKFWTKNKVFYLCAHHFICTRVDL